MCSEALIATQLRVRAHNCQLNQFPAAAIRAHYEKLLASSDAFDRQSGTAMWIIDRLALRVGGEKDEDEADTVS